MLALFLIHYSDVKSTKNNNCQVAKVMAAISELPLHKRKKAKQQHFWLCVI